MVRAILSAVSIASLPLFISTPFPLLSGAGMVALSVSSMST